MLPPIADADPDPTTQIPWPTARSGETAETESSAGTFVEETTPRTVAENSGQKVDPGRRRLSTWDLITLSISMAGAQIAWTVELGYGTPFLLGLGLSEHVTSLVWLAGPISGLIAQPVIGALSDSSTSKYRRRYWITLSTAALVVSTFTLAYCEEIASILVDLFGVGAGDWDEQRNKQVNSTAISFAVVSFYILDFALNGLQASLRNLLLDIAPAAQLNAGNAWHGRMTNAGNIVGFGFGFLPLAKLPIIRLLGGDQFRKFCVICIVILVTTVWMTCFLHQEEERPHVHDRKKSKIHLVFLNIQAAVTTLPKPIRRVCYVQLFAFMGWFPFLFYSTTYMGQIMAYEHQKEPDAELATRTGEFAMLLYSIVGVVTGILLPHLASRDRRLMAHLEDVDQDAEIRRLRHTVREWRADAARQGKPLRLPIMPFLLRNIWTGALLLFTVLMFSTFFITTVVHATVFISLVGICWAVAMWVPFAIIMEILKEGPPPPLAPATPSGRRPSHNRVLSSPPVIRRSNDERQPLLRRRSFEEYAVSPEEVGGPVAPMSGGTVLGIHNLAIVLPQFIVALVTSAIFRIVDGTSPNATTDHSTYLGKTGVGWVLRFGGLMTLFGAMLVRRVPPTPTEKAMRRRLGEMRLLGEETNP
ncbi:General alpha-glucoside permease [Hypsizygus marmoreus]|uniref:General alpha-glucoside permease n=1 Tax=Hypsizygus marmoreus TaxID=39966 RepID=A0A369JV11_HYPMA|nr:General alpha-glucoside permease [Hypsizygus marmoreus]